MQQAKVSAREASVRKGDLRKGGTIRKQILLILFVLTSVVRFFSFNGFTVSAYAVGNHKMFTNSNGHTVNNLKADTVGANQGGFPGGQEGAGAYPQLRVFANNTTGIWSTSIPRPQSLPPCSIPLNTY